MLEIQRSLLAGQPLSEICSELSLRCYEHPDLPLIGLKYNMIDSPKTHDIVRECRGLVLERDSWKIVAKGFDRFFNLGEDRDLQARFDWSEFEAVTKEDGSLILLYRYAGQWRINTSGSFAQATAQWYQGSWEALFWSQSGLSPEILDQALAPVFDKGASVTLVLELCSPYTRVLRAYPQTTCYLLSVFEIAACGQSVHEWLSASSDTLAQELQLPRPERFQLSSCEQVMAFLKAREAEDRTYEGLVLRDINSLRIKCKTASYVALHHVRGNGVALSAKGLVPVALAGEVDEVLAYLPQLETALRVIEHTLQSKFHELAALWLRHRRLSSQKDFALAVKDHPLSNLLFRLRSQQGATARVEDLRDLWRDSGELLARRLFSDLEVGYDMLTAN